MGRRTAPGCHRRPDVPKASGMRAATREDFAKQPFGCYLAGRTWMVFYAPHGLLSGLMLWGEPDEDDIREFAACSVRHHAWLQPHASIVDVRRVRQILCLPFHAYTDFVTGHRAAIDRSMTRLAVLHDGGMAAATAGGAAGMIFPDKPIGGFTDPGQAPAWLRRAADAPPLDYIQRVRESHDAAPVLHHPVVPFLES